MHKYCSASRINKISTLLCFGLLLISCAELYELPRVWPEKRGVVIDSETKKPLKRVVVLARWKGVGGGWVHAQSRCYHVESAITNEKGEFILPEYSEGFTTGFTGRRYVDLIFHVSGYLKKPKSLNQYFEQNEYLLSKFSGKESDRVDYLSKIAVSCSAQDGSERNTLIMYESIKKELAGFKVTEGVKKLINHYRYAIDILEIGWKKTQVRYKKGFYQ